MDYVISFPGIELPSSLSDILVTALRVFNANGDIIIDIEHVDDVMVLAQIASFHHLRLVCTGYSFLFEEEKMPIPLVNTLG